MGTLLQTLSSDWTHCVMRHPPTGTVWGLVQALRAEKKRGAKVKGDLEAEAERLAADRKREKAEAALKLQVNSPVLSATVRFNNMS